MRILKGKITLLIFCGIIGVLPKANGQFPLDDKHVKVSLRMIGHQMLLEVGDSTSRVLPVENNGDSYQLSFDTPLAIDPGQLVQLVDSIVKHTNIAKSYLVEIHQCENEEVLYSYEIGGPEKMDIVPCLGRELPEDCYLMSFTILEAPLQVKKPTESNLASTSGQDLMPMAISTALLIIITALWFYFRRKREEDGNSHLIVLGSYGFDTRNMELLRHGRKTELTSKECDLLLLLYNSVNETLEREIILNQVWGDEGDYVGRTLDVFISKLRKKLEDDPNLKIVNVRGVGYKLVVNG